MSIAFNVSIPLIKTSLRGVNYPRSCATFIARKHFGHKLIDIGNQIGIECYQTVSSAARKFALIIEQDEKYQALYLNALKTLNLMDSDHPEIHSAEHYEFVNLRLDTFLVRLGKPFFCS